MGRLFYWLSVKIYILFLYLAKPFNEKAAKMLNGRKDIWKNMALKMKNVKPPIVWIHCASLGEFEQGRPVMEKMKRQYAGISLVVTFFSVSGYEVRKNYAEAEAVFYLPFDSRKNAVKFISLVNPSLAFFVKYEFWYYYLYELKKKNIPVISFSTIFRPNQLFFKSYGGFYRNLLQLFDHFFVQNKKSHELLTSIGMPNVSLSGDTRFDRVNQVSGQPQQIPVAEAFKGQSKVFVIGSSWPNDIETIVPFVNKWLGNLKFIIAPHELADKNLDQIENLIKGKTIRFSKATSTDVSKYDVLLIDNIGMLSSLYSYGEYAYIGGAFDGGLHNTLEAAAYGIPVFFGKGKKNVNFQEAGDLVAQNAAFEIDSWQEIDKKVTELYNDQVKWTISASAAKNYIRNNTGATEKIVSYSEKYLKK